MKFADALAAVLADTTLDAERKLAKIAELVAEEQAKPEDASAAAPGATPAAEGLTPGAFAIIEGLKKQIDDLALGTAKRDREALAVRLLGESRLPETAVTPVFRETLFAATNEVQMKRLIEDRRFSWGTGHTRTTSRDPGARPATGLPRDQKTPAQMINPANYGSRTS